MCLLFFAMIIMTGIGSWNRRRKPLFSCSQSENGIATPPLPLNAIVAQRGASWGIYQRKKNGQCRGTKSRSARPASIANGVPFAAENGRTRAPFGFAGKRLASNRPPFHIGRAVPAEISELAEIANWRQNNKTRKILESEKEKAPNIAYNHGGVTGVRESFKTE